MYINVEKFNPNEMQKKYKLIESNLKCIYNLIKRLLVYNYAKFVMKQVHNFVVHLTVELYRAGIS